jgi:hypothetical protein
MMAIGLFLLSLVTGSSGYSALVPGMVVFGAGLGLFLSSVTTAGVTALDPSRASLGGGTLHMLQLTGGSVGLGLTTAVFTSAFHSTVDKAHAAGILAAGQEHMVNGLLATGSITQLARRFPVAAHTLNHVSQDAFATGMHSGFRVTAGLAALGCLVCVTFIGRRLRPKPSSL